jgi:hypothetical protein
MSNNIDYDFDQYDEMGDDIGYFFEQDHGFLTNFQKEIRGLYEKAISSFESSNPEQNGCLFIKDEAYDCHGTPIPYLCALRIRPDIRSIDIESFYSLLQLFELEPEWLERREFMIQGIIIRQSLDSKRYQDDIVFKEAADKADEWYTNTYHRSAKNESL